MEILGNLGLGLGVALGWQNLLYCLIGCVLGTLVGVLPGLGPVATVAMLLPNAELPAIRVRAGQRLQYPDPAGDLLFRALAPAGGGLVRAFVTSEPLGIAVPSGEDYAHGGAAFAGQVTAALMTVAGQMDGAVRLDSWGTASIVYDIHD